MVQFGFDSGHVIRLPSVLSRRFILVQFGFVAMRLPSVLIWLVLRVENRRIDTPVPDKRHRDLV